VALFLLSFIIWAVLHSLTAGPAGKERFRARFGQRAYEGWYRLIYNAFSVLSILPVMAALYLAVPAQNLWVIAKPWSNLALAARLLALIGLGFSLWQTDVLSFLGIRQLIRYWQGEPFPAAGDRFVESGTYAWVRHPLYLFSMIYIWLNPIMTLSTLSFNIMATLYFGIGSIYEEHRLQAAFGERYIQYRQRVPRFVPWPRGQTLKS
jgi:protein-S-isoprenylcysteine O-methyltransferase Ste14